jgi:hypothetical protein
MHWLLSVALLLILQASPAATPQAGKSSSSGSSPITSLKNSPLAPPEPYTVNVGKIPTVTVTAPKRDWADWGYWIFSALLVFVGGFQAWLLWKTLGAIKTQANLMERQAKANEDAVTATRDNALAAKDGAEAAKANAEAAKASAEVLINSERAWVIAELVPMAAKYGGHWHRFETYGPVPMSTEEILAGHHLRYKLKFTNMGRGPAQILGFVLVYTCLGEGVTDLPESGGGERVLKSYRAFEHLLGVMKRSSKLPNLLSTWVGTCEMTRTRLKGWRKQQ